MESFDKARAYLLGRAAMFSAGEQMTEVSPSDLHLMLQNLVWDIDCAPVLEVEPHDIIGENCPMLSVHGFVVGERVRVIRMEGSTPNPAPSPTADDQ